ncbi:hypothetical protein ACIREO_38070 [Streptomyces sp. NPDC102441]|uniref:hypothetical protein n=1 Tax=Streptomyces sp. NPDC102441 TaxID=3366176 RepID=UPI003809F423
MQFRRRMAETGRIAVEARGGPDEEWTEPTAAALGHPSPFTDAWEVGQAVERGAGTARSYRRSSPSRSATS